MKKIFLILFAVIILLVLGVVFFVATLDVDRFRPQILAKLETAIGKPVKLDKISLSWHNGLALSLQGLAILDQKEGAKPLVELNSAKAVLSVEPLLAKQIQISSVYLDAPVIRLTRKADGTFQGWSDAKPEQQSSGGNAAALAFLITNIQLDGGEVFYRDETGRAPLETTLRNVDIELSDVAINSPIKVNAKAGVLSQRQNTKVTGILKVMPTDQSFTINDFVSTLDLNQIDLPELARLVPELAASGPLPQVKGNLELRVETLKFDTKGLGPFVADLNFTGGSVKLPDLAEPVQQIEVRAQGNQGEIRIQNASAIFAGSEIQGRGTVNLKTLRPISNFEIGLKNLAAEALTPPARAGEPKFKGTISANFKGSAAGFSGPEILQSLNAQGQVAVDEPVLENMNVMKEVFKKLSMVPGLMDKLRQRLPEDYSQKLEARDTYFKTILQPVLVQEGVLLLKPVNIESETFAVQGVATANLIQQFASGQANLLIEPYLSEALIRSVVELQSLADRQGVLQIPLIIQGPLSNIKVVPDIQFIASRVAMTATQNALSSLLRPQTSPTGQPAGQTIDPSTGQPVQALPGTTGTTQPQSQKLPKGKDLLGALLQSAIQSQSGASQDSNQQQ